MIRAFALFVAVFVVVAPMLSGAMAAMRLAGSDVAMMAEPGAAMAGHYKQAGGSHAAMDEESCKAQCVLAGLAPGMAAFMARLPLSETGNRLALFNLVPRDAPPAPPPRMS